MWEVHGSAVRLLPKALKADGRAVWLADSEYVFDAAFAPEVETTDVYEAAASDIASAVLAGCSCTLIAFGQTASGKTFTMLGGAGAMGSGGADIFGATAAPGLISLAFRDLLRLLEGEAGTSGTPQAYGLKMSCVEVYNEQCNDLLAPANTNLRLYEGAGGAVVVRGVSEVAISSEVQLWGAMQVAEAQRRVGSTHSNDRSSRSHLVVTVSVESWARDARVGGVNLPTTRTLQLVDLAGSERCNLTTTGPERGMGAESHSAADMLMRESSRINRLERVGSAVGWRPDCGVGVGCGRVVDAMRVAWA